MGSEVPSHVGRYKIESELGRGAMGAVYRGVDPKLDRTVAIKMISSAVTAGGDDREEMLARFEREARISAKLQHPNVVAVYDVGVEGDEIFLVMELVDGDTLSHRLARGDFPPVAETLDLIAQSADALAAAHEAGIIHRDIKPGNMLITRSGRVKVMDFGVAKAVGEKMDLTRTGMMVGSPAYMSPEQVKGMMLDGRSDLFSLGVVLFEMLLHRKPFPADTVTTLVYQILHEDPMKDVPIPDAVSQDLADFMRWTMAKDREARIPDARTFAARARALAAGQPLIKPEAMTPTTMMPIASAERTTVIDSRGLASPAPQQTTPVLEKKSNTGLWAGIAAAVLIGGGLGFWLLSRGGAPAEQAATQAAEAAAPETALQVGVTERPVMNPSTEAAAAPALTISIPDQEPGRSLAEPEPGASDLSEAAPAPERRPAATAARPRVVETPAAPREETVAAPSQSAAAASASSPSQGPAGGFQIPQVEIAETYEARRVVEFRVRPDTAIVTINGVTIGKADDWDGFGGGKPYPIPYPGDYYVQLNAPGFQTTWIKIVISPGARDDTARIRTRMPKAQ